MIKALLRAIGFAKKVQPVVVVELVAPKLAEPEAKTRKTLKIESDIFEMPDIAALQAKYQKNGKNRKRHHKHAPFAHSR